MRKEPIPKFESEEEERNFWLNNESTNYIDWKKAESAVLPNLKPSTKTISLRMPVSLLSELKALANKKDVPYQSLIKIFLSKKVQEERKTV